MKRHAELFVLGLATLLFAFLWWRHLREDVSRFVVFGAYDGQFYYRLAVAPFSTAPVVAGVRFDYPAYRQQRILYPLIVHVLSGGNPRAALWLLPLVNCAAIVAIGWLGLRLAPNLGSLAAYWPGFLFSLARDLAEPMEIALLFAAIWFGVARRPYLCAAALTCAALTRETALIAAAVFVVLGLGRRDFHLAAGLTAIAAFAFWKWTVFEMWQLPLRLGAENVLGRPFAAIWSLFFESWHAHDQLVQVVEMIALALFSLIVASALWHSNADIVIKASCIAYGCFAIVLTREIWVEDWAYLRAIAEFGALGGVIIATSSDVIRRVGAILIVGGWLGIAIEVLRFR